MWRPRRFTARRSAAQPPPQQRRSRRHHQRPPPPWAASSGRSLRAQHIPHRMCAAAARSPLPPLAWVPELQPEMQSTGIETHIHHQNVQASQKKIRQDTRYARFGGAAVVLLRALGDYKKRWRYVGLFYRFIIYILHGFEIDQGFHSSLISLNKLSEL